jgi:hypothetical protein
LSACAAADIRCLIAIVSHLIKPTPWRKDVRLLRVQDTIDQFYHQSDDMDEARKQAESFLSRRLRRMFRDLTSEEQQEMEQRGVDMIDAVEQRVLAEREVAAEEAAAKAASVAMQQAFREDDEALSEEELGNGATIGRVEIRVAGRMRHIRRKIIRDPDDDFRFVLAQRNRESGELEPVLKRGVSRGVERGNDGFWRIRSN